MEYEFFKETLESVFDLNGLSHLLDEEKTHKLYMLQNELLRVNEYMNLTAIKDEKEIILKHFADSATVADKFEEGATVLDVGAGGGFPSLPLAILRPDVKVTSLDATRKKLDFICSSAKLLSLDNLTTVCGRAEELAHDKTMRESFDGVCARAVAQLNILCEWCLGFVRVGGIFVAMKAKGADDEEKISYNSVSTMGGKFEECIKKELVCDYSDEKLSRNIILIRKIKNTSDVYPRKNARIQKCPL